MARRYAALVLLLAAAMRVAWVMAVPVVPVSDSARYDFFAKRLATGLGYTEAAGEPTAYWPVGPSFLFSLVYRLTGPDNDARLVGVAMLNLLMGTASVGLTMYLGTRWFSPRAGLIAGVLLALWPSQVQFTTVLASETPMIFFMLAALAIWYSDRPGPLLRSVLAGVFLAAASFMRPTALLLPLVIGVSDLIRRPQRLKTIGSAAVTLATMAILILPWSLRNQRVFGEFVLISTNGGTNFWMGNNPATTGGYQSPPWDGFASEVDRERQLRHEAVRYIRTEPIAFMKRSITKAIRLHERESIGVVWNQMGLEHRLAALQSGTRDRLIFALKLVTNLYWWAVLLLAFVGVLCLLRGSMAAPAGGGLLARLTCPPLLIWGYFTAVHAVTVIQDRYHFAAIPFLGMLAASRLSRRVGSTATNRDPNAQHP